MLDLDAIQKQRRFEEITITASMPGSSAELINSLLARFKDDPEKQAIIRELILVEGAKAVMSQLGDESKPVQARRGRKPKAKPEPVDAAEGP